MAPDVRLVPPDPKFFKEGCLTEAANTMSTLLTDLTTVVTQIVSWVPQAVNTIVDNPFLLLTTGFLVFGGTIGIIGRLLSRN